VSIEKTVSEDGTLRRWLYVVLGVLAVSALLYWVL